MARHRLHVLIYESEIQGIWIGHCLEMDLVSQGISPGHAREMIDEAIRLVADARIADGQSPFDIRPAPPEYWAMLASAEEISEGFLPYRLEGDNADVAVLPYVRAS
jgi:predicted RNase H-like HicB family nuclease